MTQRFLLREANQEEIVIRALVIALGLLNPNLRAILPLFGLRLGRPKSMTRTVFRMAK